MSRTISRMIASIVLMGMWNVAVPPVLAETPQVQPCVIEHDISGEDAQTLIRIIAAEEDYPADFLLAIAAQESGFRMNSVSRAGAIGLMQLMPETANSLGVNPCDPIENVRGAIDLLRLLDEKYLGNPIYVLAAYNAGEPAIDDAGGLPVYRETLDYVTRVLSSLEGWALPRSEPALASSPSTRKTSQQADASQWAQGFVLHVE